MKSCEKCNLPIDYDSRDTLCKECREAPLTSSQRRATPCLCEEGPVAVNSMIQCSQCIRWWHPACVGLTGLSKHGCSTIVNWKCPVCFVLSPELKAKLPEEESVETPSIIAEVKKGVEAAMPGMLEKIQEQYTTQLENFKTEATQFAGKTWADAAKAEQKNIVAQVAQNTSESAVKQSMAFINTNLTEMRNRVNNLIIYNIKETAGEDLQTSVHSVLQPLVDIPRSDIVKAVRLGKLVAENQRNNERTVLVTLRHEEDSKFLHNYKAGRKVEQADGRGHLWINADLTKTERDAAFKLRQQRKARRLAGAAAAERGRPQAAARVEAVGGERPAAAAVQAEAVQPPATAPVQPPAPQVQSNL